MQVEDFFFPEAVLAYMAAGDVRKRDFERVDRYVQRIHREYEKLKPVLPDKIGTVLDIGCGLAGIDVLIARSHGTKRVQLVDGDGTGPRQMGFRADTTAWADVLIGATLLDANVPRLEIFTARPSGGLWDPQYCDIAISFKSWCHHYPAETYAEHVRRVLKPSGTLIVDIRRGTNGVAVLRDYGFWLVEKVDETPKCERMVFSRE